MIIDIKGEPLYIDKFLAADLDYIKKKVLEYNHMFLCLIDGRTGTGKSTFGAQIGKYLNHDMGVESETFSKDQFQDAIDHCKKGDVIILDEAFFVMNKRKSRSADNMEILSKLQQVRLKQAFIIILLPSVYDLDKNVILNLADLFIHCYTEGPYGRRGSYSVYDRTGLKSLWLKCRQEYIYPKYVAKPIFRGRFTKKFPIDYKEYEIKKLKTFKERERTDTLDSYSKQLFQRDKLIYEMYSNGTKVEKIMQVTGLKQRTIYDSIEKIKKTINPHPFLDIKEP